MATKKTPRNPSCTYFGNSSSGLLYTWHFPIRNEVFKLLLRVHSISSGGVAAFFLYTQTAEDGPLQKWNKEFSGGKKNTLRLLRKTANIRLVF